MSGRPALTRQTLPEGAITAVTTLPDGVALSGSVANVSESGARIIGDTSGLELGSTVTITFQYPADGRQEFDCSVVRVKAGEGFAVTFCDAVVRSENGHHSPVQLAEPAA